MRHFCCKKAAFFNCLGLHFDLDFALEKIWTVFGFGMSFEKSGLDLDRKT